jgi:MerR family transcriptional regulator, mercuric resistance operon regulatory protein
LMLGGMRTRELADQAGVNTQTLRYDETRGLLAAPPRSAAGYRDYPRSAVAVLRFVKRAQELGFSLAEVEDLLALAEGGPDSCDTVQVLARTHVAELDRKVADSQRMRAALTELIATCKRPRADRSCPLLEAIERGAPLDEVPQ